MSGLVVHKVADGAALIIMIVHTVLYIYMSVSDIHIWLQTRRCADTNGDLYDRSISSQNQQGKTIQGFGLAQAPC